MSRHTIKSLIHQVPDHAKTFTVQVFVGDDPWGEGSGPSKQTAAQIAAGNALTKAEQ